MKKSIPFLALLLSLSFACNKGTDSQAVVDKPTDVQAQVGERFICCCDLIVTSVAFGGLTVCGATGPGNACQINTANCGSTCGVQKVFPAPGKNINFCFETGCPVCFTNNAAFPIQIRLACLAGNSGTIDFLANETKCFMTDCTGALIPCN